MAFMKEAFVNKAACMKRVRNHHYIKPVAMLLAAVMLLGLAGCDKNESVPESSVVSESETGFDIDRVRKSIVVKGQPFEIPKPLKEIKGDWSYKVDDTMCQEGTCLVEIYYKDELMLKGGGENYFNGKDKEAIMYNTTIKADDCSVDGITPLKTTKQEVLEKYGEPDSTGQIEYPQDLFNYGITGVSNSFGGRLNGQCITIQFTESGIVNLVSVTYADLTKEY